MSLCGLQMVRPRSSCANERRCVVEGVREMESWPQKEKSYKSLTVTVMEKLTALKDFAERKQLSIFSDNTGVKTGQR